jgi:translation elongation factor EF-G
MKRAPLVLAFLLMTAHRLPAPIREIEEAPKPAKPRTESKVSEKPASEDTMRSHSVTVVLTDNTRAAILYLRNYEGKMSSDVRADEILEKLRRALSARFPNVSISESSSLSRSAGLTMLFDLQAHVGSVSFTTNTVSFIATFKNSGSRTIQTISASGKSTIPYPAFSMQFSKAVEQAFADFSQKLAAVR